VDDDDTVVIPDVTVLVAMAHALFRTGVRDVLETHGFVVCAEAATGHEAIARSTATKPRICLVDVELPGGGIHAAGEIARRLPATAVVMLAAVENDQDLFDSLVAGADGYLLKDAAPDHLARALWGVVSGEAALPRALVTRLVREFRDRGRRRPGLGASLTEREWEVLEFIGQGRSTSDMARSLAVSPVTVRSHVSSLMKKLDVTSRAEARARYVAQH
jgi:DNA-binding NarL/FixJ family response regulator